MTFWRWLTSRGEPFEIYVPLLGLGTGLVMLVTVPVWVEAGVLGAVASAVAGGILSHVVVKASLGVLR